VALRWDRGPRGPVRAFRLSSIEEPYLRSLIPVLVETDSRASLDRGIRALLERVPRVR
jgi:hypothetical protein